MSAADEAGTHGVSHWSGIIGAVSSPIKFFALVILVCNAIFAICATILGEPMLFVYCLHMFVAMVSFLVGAALWCPSALYHPSELDENSQLSTKYNPWVPTVFSIFALTAYLVYQAFVIYSGGHPYIKPTRWQSPHIENYDRVKLDLNSVDARYSK